MKTLGIISAVAGFISLVSCSDIDWVRVKNPITISSPSPTEQITKVSLTDTQAGYVEAGNSMSFRFLKELYDEENLVCSPLSLQYALAMAANGASGETLQEIIDFLGYGEEGIEALNEYSKILLEQLPAVDLDVDLNVTNALIVNDKFPLLPSFKEIVENNYYAAVDNMDYSDPKQIAASINDWTKRSTNGFIDKLVEPSEISPEAVAFIMNALYFKAKWAGSQANPMFKENSTKMEDFRLINGKSVKTEMMMNTQYHQYAEMDGYKVLVLPYESGKFNMYILLPNENNIEALIAKLQTIAWSDILGSLKRDAEVHVKLPKFKIENKHNLNDALKALGVKMAFQRQVAEFDMMFKPKPGYFFWINKVIQKSRIEVSEWGTEAGSVTVVEMDGATDVGPGSKPKQLYFYVNHPFLFVIGEKTSGTILFEGVVMEP